MTPELRAGHAAFALAKRKSMPISAEMRAAEHAYRRTYHAERQDLPQVRERARERSRSLTEKQRISRNTAARGVYARHPEKFAERRFRRRYGLTPTKRAALFAAQEGKCAICAQPLAPGKLTHVDHNRRCCSGEGDTCGKCVRGLLCNTCNTHLGVVEKPGFVERCREYLERHSRP
jgi:hypothetical protein